MIRGGSREGATPSDCVGLRRELLSRLAESSDVSVQRPVPVCEVDQEEDTE